MENTEIILNVWYIYDDSGFIYSLRARCYVGSGSDEEKLALLRQFATTDYLIAQPFPVPKRFHTTLVRDGGVQEKVPVVHLSDIEALGGPQVLFEEAFVALEKQLPAQTNRTIGQQPLLCMTPLIGGDDGEIKPGFTKRGKL